MLIHYADVIRHVRVIDYLKGILQVTDAVYPNREA